MGYDDRSEPVGKSESTPTVILTTLVRTLGLLLLLAGLVTAAFILLEVWALYKYPEKIEVIAAAVEKGSNIDKTLLPRRTDDPDASGADNLHLSYFFAWFIAFFLILLIARIAMTAVTTGGKLALYDTEVKKLARALIEESGRRRS